MVDRCAQDSIKRAILKLLAHTYFWQRPGREGQRPDKALASSHCHHDRSTGAGERPTLPYSSPSTQSKSLLIPLPLHVHAAHAHIYTQWSMHPIRSLCTVKIKRWWKFMHEESIYVVSVCLRACMNTVRILNNRRGNQWIRYNNLSSPHIHLIIIIRYDLKYYDIYSVSKYIFFLFLAEHLI